MQDYLPPSGYKGLAGFHKYWGKKPVESWRFLIENFTNDNDIVLDPFLGSGLIAKECVDLNRRFIGFDINPISIELTRLYLQLPEYSEIEAAFENLTKTVRHQINSMYALPNGDFVSHFLWEDERITNVWIKKRHRRVGIKLSKDELQSFQSMDSYIPHTLRDMHLFNNSRINSKHSISLTNLFSPRALCAIDSLKGEIENYQGSVRRALLLILTSSLGQMSKMVFAILNRGKIKAKRNNKLDVGSWIIGYWRPDQHFEINAWNCFEIKAKKLLNAIRKISENKNVDIAESVHDFLQGDYISHVSVGDSESLLDSIPPDTVRVILTDPPHGDRIPYLELSEMWNSVIDLCPDYENELVVSDAKERGKNVESYNKKLSVIFKKCNRVLSNDGLMAVMFNARLKDHWNSLDELENFTDLNYIGCYPMEYSAGSVIQDNRKGGLKKDYVLLYGKKLKKMPPLLKGLSGWSESYPKRD